MPKATPKKTPRTPKKALDERQAFLDELEGHVSAEQPDAAEEEELDEEADEQAEADVETTPEEPIHPVAVKVEKSVQKPISSKKMESVLDEVYTSTAKESKKEEKSFDRPSRRFPWVWVIIGVVLCAAAALGGFWFYSRGPQFSEAGVTASIVAPSSVSSGDSVNIVVRYANTERVGLKNVQISVQYPDGFSYQSASVNPSGDYKNTFNIGAVNAGAVGQLTIIGHVLGSLNANLAFHATVTYQPTNFNSQFSVSADGSVMITSSVVGLTIDGPKQLAPNATGQWTISYTNASTTTVDHLRVAVNAPKSFTFGQSTPKATSSLSWDLPSLAAAAKGTIVFSGSFSGQAGDSVTLTIDAGIVKAGDVIETQNEITQLVSLANTGLTVSVGVNGQTSQPTLAPGDIATVTIGVANKSDSEVDNATVAMTVSGVGSLTNIQNPTKAKVSGQTITWTKTEVPQLAQIQPGDTVTISLVVPTTTVTQVKTDADQNPSLNLSVAITSSSLPNNGSDIKPTVVQAKVRTNAKVVAEARFYDDTGAVIGSGPIPPKVGQTTAYRITWTLTSTTNDVSGLTVTATLPTSVYFTGKHNGTDAGSIAFDPATRIVTWTLNKLPAGTGTRYPALTATFEVSITPTSDQVGSVVVLSQATALAGTDAWTTQPVSTSADPLTSDLPTDPQAAGQGKVTS